MSKELRHEKNCLNCGHFVPDRFCSHCGQENVETKESFLHLVKHVFEDITHFDSKFLNTVKTLFLKPGQLTLEYLHGKRVKYVPPVRLFIFTSFVFFVFIGILKHKPDGHKKQNTLEHYIEQVQDSVLPDSSEQDDFLNGFKEGMQTVHNNTDRQDEDTDILRTGLINIKLNKKDTLTGAKQEFEDIGSDAEAYLRKQDSLPEEKKDGYFSRKLKLFILENKHKTSDEFKEEFNEKFYHKMHYWIFILFPFFALVMKLYYLKNNMYYSEYLIFGFHFHTIILLVLLLITIIHYYTDYSAYGWGLLAVVLYLFFSLKNIFNQSVGKTLLKTFLISFTYMVIVNIFLLISSVFVIFFS